MYIPIGSDMSIRDSSIIGIFDLDNTTCSPRTREFLRRAEENAAGARLEEQESEWIAMDTGDAAL